MARGGTGAKSRFDWRGFLLLVGIYLVVALLWHTVLVHPLKLFVVLLHELSHGIAAILTGGRIVRIELSHDLGGATTTQQGAPFVIASAGYLGSLLFGVVFLLVATRTRLAPPLSAAIAVLVAVVAWRTIPSSPDPYGRNFALGMAAVLFVVATLPRPVPEVAMRVLAITSCLYAILDVKSDVLDRDVAGSDAAALQRVTGVEAWIWGVLWIGVSLAVTMVAAKWAVTGSVPADEPKRRQ